MNDAALIALRRRDGTAEFTCIECGAHVTRYAARPQDEPLCAICLSLPGWQNDPVLRRIFGDRA